MAPQRTPNRNKLNLYLDLAIFVAFLITMAPRFSGIAVHEWLSIAFAGTAIVHLLLHWTWIVNTIKRFTAASMGRNRANFVLNVLLFIDVVIIMFTGIMISEAALPLFGIRLQAGFAWRGLHDTSANLGILILALHVAIHWRWIVATFSKYVLRRSPKREALA